MQKNLTLHLDKGLVYQPGDIVSGTVYVKPALMKLVDKIEINIFGVAKVAFFDENTCMTEPASLCFSNEKVLTDRTYAIYKKPEPFLIQLSDNDNHLIFPSAEENDSEFEDSENIIPNQKCHHKFQVQLPNSGLESSFESPECPVSITYFVTVSLYNEACDLLFEGVQPVKIINTESHSSSNQATKLIQFEKSRVKFADLDVPQRTYTSMSKLNAKITIENGSKFSIGYSHLSLVQRITCTGCLPDSTLVRTVTKETDFSGVGLPENIRKIKPGIRISYEPDYYLTALIPSFEIENLAKVEYFVKLVFGKTLNHIYGQVMVPIQIVIQGAH